MWPKSIEVYCPVAVMHQPGRGTALVNGRPAFAAPGARLWRDRGYRGDAGARLREAEVSVRHLRDAVRRLTEAGTEVVVGTCPDLGTIQPIRPPLRWVRWPSSSRASSRLHALVPEPQVAMIGCERSMPAAARRALRR